MEGDEVSERAIDQMVCKLVFAKVLGGEILGPKILGKKPHLLIGSGHELGAQEMRGQLPRALSFCAGRQDYHLEQLEQPLFVRPILDLGDEGVQQRLTSRIGIGAAQPGRVNIGELAKVGERVGSGLRGTLQAGVR